MQTIKVAVQKMKMTMQTLQMIVQKVKRAMQKMKMTMQTLQMIVQKVKRAMQQVKMTVQTFQMIVQKMKRSMQQVKKLNIPCVDLIFFLKFEYICKLQRVKRSHNCLVCVQIKTNTKEKKIVT
jgi:paraquat-inducible protein B